MIEMLVWNCVAVIYVRCSPYPGQELPTYSHVSFPVFSCIVDCPFVPSIGVENFHHLFEWQLHFLLSFIFFSVFDLFYFRLLLLKGDLRSVVVCKLVSLVFNESR